MSGGPDAGPRDAGADLLTALGGFTRTLRAAGVPVTPDRTAGFVRACLEVGVADRSAVYWAGRATLCGDPEHLRPYDLAFEAWFGGRLARSGRPNPYQRPRASAVAALPDAPRGGQQSEPDRPGDEQLRAAASPTEVLRHRDVADLDAA